MGNCFVCFKAPSSAGLEHNSQPCSKEEMPEVAHLYPAPSHVVASAAPTDSSAVSNGNHLVPLGQELSSSSAPTQPVSRFYPYSHRWNYCKSAPNMGISDSKPSDAKLTALFEQYKDKVEDAILAEGILQFCKDLQIPPEDFRILVLAWKLNAEQMCQFTRSEFIDGLKSIRADSIKAINARLPEIVSEVERDADQFKDLYRFTFKFGLDATIGQRSLPSDMAITLWKLVFSRKELPILRRWLNFLEIREDIRSIQRDTWNMFLNFAETIGNDLSSYDDNEAWPSLFDEFVEYENDQANQNVVKDKDMDGIIIKQGGD